MIKDTAKYRRTLPAEAKEIAREIKKIVLKYDSHASVILFGSRARGDAADESDWDFLVLTDVGDTESLAAILRKNFRTKLESRLNIVISLMVKNRKAWEDDYAVTNIYESIAEEGVAL